MQLYWKFGRELINDYFSPPCCLESFQILPEFSFSNQAILNKIIIFEPAGG
jgi:hypothetical protein